MVSKQAMLVNDKTKILLVDDDRTQRFLLRIPLEKKGFKIFEADNGETALDVCKANPDLRIVVTDLTMPAVDGYELIRLLRAQELRYTYIIVLTASDDRNAVVQALSLGADDFLTKAVFPDELQLRIEGGLRMLNLESQKELIFSMVRLSEYRSNETGYHLERTEHYSRLLARDLAENCPALNITAQLAEEIANVTPLHDIGKVAIPDCILHKPGKLLPEEMEIMKTHTTIGGQLLYDLYKKTGAFYLKVAHELAMYHHERFDGNGYPEGLKGDDIPIAARIMALADIYDAMSSKRCYKEARSHDEIKAILLQERNQHLDPRVVDAFLRQEDIWVTIRERFNDLKKTINHRHQTESI